MPLYDYLCDHCGPFSETRPMAEYRSPAYCPSCDGESPRVLLSAPAMGLMSSEIRHAHGVNERAAHAPKTSAELRAATDDGKAAGAPHGAGCACCRGTGQKAATVQANDGSKAFPTKRPWMISH